MLFTKNLIMLLGGITLFMFGLKLIGDYTQKLVGVKVNKALNKCTKNRFAAAGIGALATGIAQSSVATNIVTIGLVNSSVLTFISGAAVVIGTNVGTTVTAQLVSLSQSTVFSITIIGAILGFVGFCISFFKNETLKNAGYVLIGFFLIFFGLDVITETIEIFKQYTWFENLFLVNSGAVLILNGFFITAVCQSSSAVTSMLVVLAGSGLLNFTRAAYLILGANVGVTAVVLLLSLNKNEAGVKVAVFNVLFNVFGMILFLPILSLFGEKISVIFSKGLNVSRQIANFHTFFNLFTGVLSLILLKPFTMLTEKIVNFGSDKRIKSQNSKLII